MSYAYDYDAIPQGATCRGFTLSGDFWMDASGFKMDRKALHPDIENIERIEMPGELETNDDVKEWLVSIQPPHKRKEMRQLLESDAIPVPDIEGEWINRVHMAEEDKEELLREYLRQIRGANPPSPPEGTENKDNE